MAATAGRGETVASRANTYVADFLPGCAAAERSRLVVCNGGSPTTQQALAAGKPVLGLPCNLDQYLNMQAVCDRGAGRQIRSDAADPKRIREAVTLMLEDRSLFAAAEATAAQMANYQAAARFAGIVAEALSDRHARRAKWVGSSIQ
jgi:UDP:flavonoid glycosyltransferase YjiC (YdhE family)